MTVTDVQIAGPLVESLEFTVDSVPIQRNSEEGRVTGRSVGFIVADWVRVNMVGVSVAATSIHEHADGYFRGAGVV